MNVHILGAIIRKGFKGGTPQTSKDSSENPMRPPRYAKTPFKKARRAKKVIKLAAMLRTSGMACDKPFDAASIIFLSSL